jgi:putative transposase
MAVEPGHGRISIKRQCELLGLSRAAYYYDPHPVSEKDLLLMRRIDEEYTRHPFYGSRSLRNYLKKRGHRVGRDRVRRLMRIMGIEAVYPKRRLSVRNEAHKVYPYLLRGLEIDRSDQVWCVDITYIRLKRSFAYLVAVMDWFSRYVLSWELSLSMEAGFCVTALASALEVSIPEILNSDRGSQFTSTEFTTPLLEAGVAISMDGKGRVFDNIMIERLWRTVKYEEVYLKDYTHVFAARESLESYFAFYNEERGHSNLGGKTPFEAYWDGRVLPAVAV